MKFDADYSASTVVDGDLARETNEVSEKQRSKWLDRIKRSTQGRYSFAVLSAVLLLADFALMALCGALLHYTYVYDPAYSVDLQYVALTLIVAGATAVCINIAGGYGAGLLQPFIQHHVRVMAVLSGIFLITMGGIFLAKLGDEFSRVWLVGLFFLSSVVVTIGHAIMRAAMRNWHEKGILNVRVVVVGGGEPAKELISSIKQNNSHLVEFVGMFDDRQDERSPDTVYGLPKLGNISDVPEFARDYDVDMLIITLPLSAENRLLNILKRLWILPVDIRLSAHAQRLRYRPRAYSWLGNVPMIDVLDRPLQGWGQIAKSIEDKIIASLALIVLSPLMLAIAIAVRLESKGPALFRQTRYGFNNKPIEVLKFRSMYTDMCDAKADKLVTKDDPRVTRIGRFLRKSSLDELPQFINVLRGDLSLVGPRPHAHNAKAANQLYDNVVDGYFARHKVKPGITGWAQINGWRGETDTEEKIQRRVEFDLYYIENWSILFDLKILICTPFALMKSENAY